MNPFPKLQYEVTSQIFDAKSMLDEQNFYHQKQGKPSILTQKMAYILGDYFKANPLTAMTMGGQGYGNKNAEGTSSAAVELDDVQFTYPVMGRDTKVSYISSTLYSDGDTPGKGNQPFYMFFPDNWIKRFYKIVSERGTTAYVLETPESWPTGGYRYKVQLDPAGPADFCPVDQLQEGVGWIELHTLVAESESRTTESKMVMPGMFKNQMSFMRAGMDWAGNAANKVMSISMKNPVNGMETTVWMDWFMWQFEKRWMEECEHFFWYSKYNRLVDGSIPLKDLVTGKVIPAGAGLLDQILNKTTYSKLTYNSLVNKVGDALFGMTDSNDMNITLMTGTGGIREFDRAMKEAGAQVLGAGFGAGNVADKFVTGSGRNLALGGFFDTFYHIDGHTIKVKKASIFDHGRMAQVSPLHPESGLPLESYRMVFVDDSDVDGQPNIQHVVQKGRAYLDGVIKGLTPMPRSLELLVGNSSDNKVLSTDVDKAGYTRMKSGGIQLLRGNRCFDLQCIAGF